MKQNELMLNRLTEGQSVPRPHFGDAAIVFDSDGVFKYVDGNDGEMRLIYPPNNVVNFFPEAKVAAAFYLSGLTSITSISYGSILDLTISGKYLNMFLLTSSNSVAGTLSISKINGASKLTSIKNIGTAAAFTLIGGSLSAQEINKFFTELPPTTETATLDLRFNTGSATCTPSIATDKGYTVVV